jgi:hypothetical protein
LVFMLGENYLADVTITRVSIIYTILTHSCICICYKRV